MPRISLRFVLALLGLLSLACDRLGIGDKDSNADTGDPPDSRPLYMDTGAMVLQFVGEFKIADGQLDHGLIAFSVGNFYHGTEACRVVREFLEPTTGQMECPDCAWQFAYTVGEAKASGKHCDEVGFTEDYVANLSGLTDQYPEEWGFATTFYQDRQAFENALVSDEPNASSNPKPALNTWEGKPFAEWGVDGGTYSFLVPMYYVDSQGDHPDPYVYYFNYIPVTW